MKTFPPTCLDEYWAMPLTVNRHRSAFDRWTLQLDMNCDGAFTISDIWLMAKYAFFAPGDLVLSFVASIKLGTFFDLSKLTFGGGASAVMSIVGWLFIFTLLGILFGWLEVCLNKIDQWRNTFVERVDRLRGREGILKKKPSYDEWIELQRREKDW